ncbi:uncharacterized protein LOC134714083 [Mytilus trossulus]|uniref:uncharacterized protein LOC134714083 n=1 Tax=Mytilus trossulus TaxID=6551 RepID=UPI003007D22A
MSFQIAYCGSECFEIEQKEHGENKDNNIQISLPNNTKDEKVGEGAKSFATEVTSKWLNFSLKLHDFVNSNYNRYIEDFTNDEVENKIKRRRNCAQFVLKQVDNENKSCLLPIVSGLNITDPKTTEIGTIALDERLTETEDAKVHAPVKMSGFLSSSANPWTSDDNIANDENVTPVEQVQPEGCFCWPLVHLIYRIRYRLFDKKKDKKLQKKTKR